MSYDLHDDRMDWTEYQDLLWDSLHECYRVLVPGGRICVDISNVARVWHSKKESWVKLMPKVLWRILDDIGFLEREQIIWQKYADPGMAANLGTAWGSWASASCPWLRATVQPILVADKDTHYRHPIGVSDLTSDEFKLWTRNAWLMPFHELAKWRKIHPAMFPEEFPRRLIKLYSYVGETVLDPFGGLGTTAMIADRLGRTGISIDTSHTYSSIATERINNARIAPA